MPNFIKRIQKFPGNQLHEGETILATAFLQQKGSLSTATARATLGLIGMLFSHFLAKGEQHKKDLTATPLTQKIPAGTVLMAVTNKRIIIYKHKEMGASVESFVNEYKFGDIIKVDLKSRFIIMTVVILHFKDGGSIALEAVMGQKLKDFAKLAVK